MARYIDVEKVNLKGISVFDENLEVLIPLSAVRKALQMTPTADVVSKSEVSEAVKKLVGTTYKVICESKAEVAREIFEEIEKILKTQERYLYCNPSLTYVYELIEELKKKYTESENG